MARSTTEQREHFQALVHRAEALGRADPSAYRRRILWLALLGYAVLFGVLFLLLALLVGSVWAALASSAVLLLLLKKKLIFVLGYLIYAIARALWVKVELPQGYELDLRRHPQLAAVLDELRRELDTPAIHRVVLNEDFNAGISQTPRLGVFGWQRNTLILGLQLLLAMSPDQAKAVLAHELGHLSGNHSRFSAWIYRVRQSWYRVMEAFDQSGHWGSRWLARFFDWYAPHFDAFSFALARANEYEADALSARLTSREAAASALVASRVGAEYLGQTYWRPFIARADLEARPDALPYQGMAHFLGEAPPDKTPLLAGLGRALEEATGHSDTHPALKDRLAALGAEPQPPQPVAVSAARAWLGAGYQAVLDDFDRMWLERNGDAWEARFRNAEEIRTGLAELNAKVAAETELTPQEAWQRAAWSEQLGVDALPLYQAYARAHPDDPDGDLAVGRLMLDRDDAAGLAHLERAAGHFHHALAACNAAYGYCLRTGDKAAADAWLRRGEAQMDLQNAAREERAQVMPKDELLDSGLGPETLAQLARHLKDLGQVKHAWICRKAVKIRPEEPVYVLAFQATGWFPKEEKRVRALVERFEGPGPTFIIMKGGQAKKLAKRVMGVGQRIL